MKVEMATHSKVVGDIQNKRLAEGAKIITGQNEATWSAGGKVPAEKTEDDKISFKVYNEQKMNPNIYAAIVLPE